MSGVTLLLRTVLRTIPCTASQKFTDKYDDPMVAWDFCPDGRWMAWMLVKLGFDFDRVIEVVLSLSREIPDLMQAYARNLPHRNAVAADLVAHAFCSRSGISSSDLADLYREAFSADEVFAAVEARMA